MIFWIKTVVVLILLAVFCSSCVVRTVKEKPAGDYSGGSAAFGYQHKPKVKKKAVMWIWQDEYKNPK